MAYNDENYEVDDFDEDIKSREALLEEAKQLDTSLEWNDVVHEITNLKRRWKRISYWESDYEDQLAEQFDALIDVFYAKRKEGNLNAQALKQELVERASALAVSEEWNKATEEMNELMLQWKAAGSAGKDIDDALWAKFNDARQVFFDRKHEHWEQLQEKFENARTVKRKLIDKAASLKDSEEWQKTGEEFRKLMDEWKAVGSAGREQEDTLWNEFNAYRQNFYDRRGQHYDALREVFDQKYKEKALLVEKAREIAAAKQYTRENTEQMKNLSKEWKTIGSCGKEREDEIWTSFRTAMDEYFDGLKNWNEQKHVQWRQRMQEARTRKLELIQDQKRHIKRMQDEMVGLLGQRAIDEMEERIEDTKEFIQELEEELADIDARLAE